MWIRLKAAVQLTDWLTDGRIHSNEALQRQQNIYSYNATLGTHQLYSLCVPVKEKQLIFHKHTFKRREKNKEKKE